LAPFTTANVAEVFLGNGGIGTGTGAWAISAPITVASSGAVTLTLSFTNDLVLNNTFSVGTVEADFGYNFSIKNGAGVTIFDSSPTILNQSVSLTGFGSTLLPGAGTVSITSGTLAAGTYTATLAGNSHVFANVPAPAVPDSGSAFALLTLSLIGLVGATRLRLIQPV
jgi:hypothetical protein